MYLEAAACINEAQKIMSRLRNSGCDWPPSLLQKREDMENDFHAPQTLVDLWRVQTQIAYDLYQLAKEAVHEADEERAAAPQPGGFVLNRALRIERAALAEYKRVLRIFTDLLIDGKLRDHKGS